MGKGEDMSGVWSSPKRIVLLERLTLSRNGNPRWELLFNDGSHAATGKDSAVGYEIDNPEWQQQEIQVLLDRRGQIVGIRPAVVGGP